ncbi:MAG: SatD family protein [Oscillospiraceae bacterium]|nr:SatD family protein [Oscillospiraceae bacterium]MDD4413712.1 SatD family protein [Oscillospiraceae bacterium]
MYKFNYNSYIAVIGDIKKSRKLHERKEIQNKMQKVLNLINQKYHQDIGSDFMITLGDEFQGLLNNGENIINIILEIRQKMAPVNIRFGIGVGEITTGINRNMPLGADGPAYHNAREMIEYIKKLENKKETYETNIMISTQGDNDYLDSLLNVIFSLCSTIEKSWTSRQREIIAAYMECDHNQYKTAEKLGIKQSGVSRSLLNADYYTYKNGMEKLSSILSKIKVGTDV